MKRIFTFLAAVLITASLLAQSPEKISYQAVIRNSNNELVINQSVGMQLSILQGSADGTEVYVETHTPTTNENGLVSIEIGAGTVVSGDFTTIDWANGPYFLKTETDPVGGTDYTITGTSQLLSVPYALHAKTAESIKGGITETDPVFNESAAAGITENDITSWNNKLDTESDPKVTNNFDFNGAKSGDILKFNGTKWVKATPNYLSSEEDPSLPNNPKKGEMIYWDGRAWVLVKPTFNDSTTLQLINSIPQWVGGSTPVVTNPITGKIWVKKNLGSLVVAESLNHKEAYGDLYQWGRGPDGHQKRSSDYTYSLSATDTPNHSRFIVSLTGSKDWRSPKNDNLWQGVNGINNPCPEGFRLPTIAEWEEESQTWSSADAYGAFASPLKLTLTGARASNAGHIFGTELIGGYWSSTIDGNNSKLIRFGLDKLEFISHPRASGHAVRCIKD